MNNERVKIRIGVVYMPQEKKTGDSDLTSIYKVIKGQINQARQREENLIITGDFNCKVGNKIPDNKEVVSKGGKKLLKMIENEKMLLVNATDKCEGKWTREENGNKSIFYYTWS